MGHFTDEHRAVLDFERRLYTHAGPKEAAIRDELDMSPTRYWQLLAHALDQPEAVAYDAQTVKRLLRLREKRAEARRGRVYGRAG